MGITGITDGPAGPTTDMPIRAAADGPRFEEAPKRPDGPSTFLVAKTSTCVWCQKTLDFLQALHEVRGDFQVAVLDATEHRDAFEKIARHTRRTTVPQIFLDGRLVGGWNDLAVAAKKGRLDAYLDGEEWSAPAPKRRWWRRHARET